MFERCFGAVGTRKRFLWVAWSFCTLAHMLLCIFAGLTASALEAVTASRSDSGAQDNTDSRMIALLQANCVGAILFSMCHFIISLGFLMGRWFTSAPPGMLYAILCTQTACCACLQLSMASPLVAYDKTMEELTKSSAKGSDGMELWNDGNQSLFRLAFAFMFAVAGSMTVFLGALVMAKPILGTAPPPPEEPTGGFWSRKRDVEAPAPARPPPPADDKPGFFSRFTRDKGPDDAFPPAPARAAEPALDDNTRSNPLFRFGRGADDDAPPMPAPRYQAPVAPAPPARPAFASAFASGRFASGDEGNPFGDTGASSGDNPFASSAGSVAWGAATSPGAASRGSALYEMSSRR